MLYLVNDFKQFKQLKQLKQFNNLDSLNFGLLILMKKVLVSLYSALVACFFMLIQPTELFIKNEHKEDIICKVI